MTAPSEPTASLYMVRLRWAFAILVSAGATWSMARTPPSPSADLLPAPRPRPPSPEERAEVVAMGARLAEAIMAASERHGSLLPASEYEARDPAGTPWLPEGLPDNPLTPAVAWVWEGCAPQPMPTPPPDWTVCPRTATLRAGGLLDAPSWPLWPASEAEPLDQGSGNP